jgi:hypothetical protein
MRRVLAMLTLAFAGQGCDDAPVQGGPPDGEGPDASASLTIDGGLDATFADATATDATWVDAAALPYARGVQSFREGSSAGYGRSDYPGVVLGPPSGKGTNAGGLDVLSLGVGGEIVLDFGSRVIVDGPGPDFIVFENPFWAGGSAAAVFAELGEVSVSTDLTTWLTFPCSQQATLPGVYPGCAGWTPTLDFNPSIVDPLDPKKTGGDSFDLATVSAPSARYVRVRDLANSGQADSAGFDLDAIGIIHVGP